MQLIQSFVQTAVKKYFKMRLYEIIRNSIICHSIPERCFCINNHRLPICARCTGILIGGIITIAINFILNPTLNLIFSVAFIIPMVIDGTTQLFGWRKSNNSLRFLTGFLAGIGIVFLSNRVGDLILNFIIH